MEILSNLIILAAVILGLILGFLLGSIGYRHEFKIAMREYRRFLHRQKEKLPPEVFTALCNYLDYVRMIALPGNKDFFELDPDVKKPLNGGAQGEYKHDAEDGVNNNPDSPMS